MAGGVFVLSHPATNDRPAVHEAVVQATKGTETVPLRLWQDPLGALRRVLQGENAGSFPACSLEELGERVVQATSDYQEKDAGSRLEILAVFVPGSGHAEDAERRRRERYALVSALGRTGFAPDDERHLGYLHTCWETSAEYQPWLLPEDPADAEAVEGMGGGTMESNLPMLELDVPFEWWNATRRPRTLAGRADRVLVLWLDEDVTGGQSFVMLDRLLCMLAVQVGEYSLGGEEGQEDRAYGEGHDRFERAIDLHVLGPASSPTLARILREDKLPVRRDEASLCVDESVAERGSPAPVGEDSALACYARCMARALVSTADLYRDSPIKWTSERSPERILKEQVLKELFPGQDGKKGAKPVVATEATGKLPVDVQHRLEERVARCLLGLSVDAGETDPNWARSVSRIFVEHNGPQMRWLAQNLWGSASEVSAAGAANGASPASGAPEGAGCGPQGSVVDEKPDAESLADHSRMQASGGSTSWIVAGAPERTLRDRMQVLCSRATASPSLLLEQVRGRPAWGALQLLRDPDHCEIANDEDLLDGLVTAYLGWDPIHSRDTVHDWEKGIVDGMAHPRFQRTIPSDDALALAIVDELDRLGLQTGGPAPSDRVVLVGEWDTMYGRSLPESFEAALAVRDMEGAGKESRNPEAVRRAFDEVYAERAQENRENPKALPRIRTFSYLRGLDGAGPGLAPETHVTSEDQGVQAAESAGLKAKGKTLATWTYPVGRAQLDYVDRLGDHLRGVEADYRRADEHIAAIGVTGSDVYDKQLVLQELREAFPSAVFFTTDVDAQLLHPSQYGWSRNLIIASGYGLALRDELQGRNPPFREGYQTSTYLASLVALAGLPLVIEPWGNEADPLPELPADGRFLASFAEPSHEHGAVLASEPSPKGTLPGRIPEALLRPQLFEVARNGAFHLFQPREQSELLPRGAQGGLPSIPDFLLLGLAIVLVLVVLSPLLPDLRGLSHARSAVAAAGAIGRAERPWPRDRVLFLIRTAIVLLVVAGVGWILMQWDRDEPFALTLGISVWPTVLVRLAVAGFALLVLGALRRAERRAVLEIEGRIGFAEASRSMPVERSPFLLAWVSRPAPVAQEAPGRIDGLALWAEFRAVVTPARRLLRVTSAAAAFLALVGLAQLVLGLPWAHARGAVARYADVASVWIALAAVGFVTFAITDLVHAVEILANKLTGGRTWWPRAAIVAVQTGREVSGGAAADAVDVHVVRVLTRLARAFLLLPGGLLLLLIVARNGFFDRPDWSTALVLVYLVLVAAIFLSGRLLRTTAEEVRHRVLSRLESDLDRAAGDPGRAQPLRRLIEEVRGLADGAFGTWTRLPLVHSLVVPVSGFAVVALLDYLARGPF